MIQRDIAIMRLLLRLTEATLLNPGSKQLISSKQISKDYKTVKKMLASEINRLDSSNG